jgi:hypothetical protein
VKLPVMKIDIQQALWWPVCPSALKSLAGKYVSTTVPKAWCKKSKVTRRSYYVFNKQQHIIIFSYVNFFQANNDVI